MCPRGRDTSSFCRFKISREIFSTEGSGNGAAGGGGGLPASRGGGTCRLNLGEGPAVFYSRLLARRIPCMRDPPRQPADLSWLGQGERWAVGRTGGSLGCPSDCKGANLSLLPERTCFYSSTRTLTVCWCPCKVFQLMPGERLEESMGRCLQPDVDH